jgi:hypothetical protein
LSVIAECHSCESFRRVFGLYIAALVVGCHWEDVAWRSNDSGNDDSSRLCIWLKLESDGVSRFLMFQHSRSLPMKARSEPVRTGLKTNGQLSARPIVILGLIQIFHKALGSHVAQVSIFIEVEMIIIREFRPNELTRVNTIGRTKLTSRLK